MGAKNTEAVETFIRRWQGREGGQERANYVSFLNELIALLGLPPPDPSDAILQWHFRTKGAAPDEPILRAFRNIQVKNAVLTWDGEPIPKIVDGKETYPNARRPEWPPAEFIVGNPPFIGASYLRNRLGDSFVEALWQVHSNMNESADFVMYWWDRAADLLTRKGTSLRRFGLITTNSISQVLQRKTIERHFKGKRPISLAMAIPDHPWTKATQDAAAVRIAMTVAEAGNAEGVLREVTQEGSLETDAPRIVLKETIGLIHADLTVGADVGNTVALQSNNSICHDGVKLHGRGFIVTPEEATHLGLGKRMGLSNYMRNYRNGRDLANRPRGVLVIDLFGLSSDMAGPLISPTMKF